MKAQGLSMSILVVAAIAVMVLLLLGVFFTGGFRKIGTNMMRFVEGSADVDESAQASVCLSWCTDDATRPSSQHAPLRNDYCYSVDNPGVCDGNTEIANCSDYCP